MSRAARSIVQAVSSAAPAALAAAIAGVGAAAMDAIDATRLGAGPAFPAASVVASDAALLALVGAGFGGTFAALVTIIREVILTVDHRSRWRARDVRAAVSSVFVFGVLAPMLTWLWGRPSLATAPAKIAGFCGATGLAMFLGVLGAVAWDERGARSRRAAALGIALAVAMLILAHHPRVRPHPFVSSTSMMVALLTVGDTVGPQLRRLLAGRRWEAGFLAVLALVSGAVALALGSPRTRQALVTDTLAGADLLSMTRFTGLWSPSELLLSDVVLERDTAPSSRLFAPGAGVVIVTVDSLRADRLGAYGGPAGMTPNLDRFMQKSVVFDRAYAQFPSTTGSVPSLLTGSFPWRPVDGWRAKFLERPTLARRLRAHGYQTASFFSSWSLRDAQGFFTIDRARLGFEGGSSASRSGPKRVQEALDFLEHAQHPFVWIHVMEPHEPYSIHEDLPGGPANPYDNEVAFVDHTLSPLLDFFDRHEDLIVWFTADHGEAFGEHGRFFHASSVYDEQIRVPLAVRVPGLAPRRVKGPIQLLDIAPTTLALLRLNERGLDGRDRRDELEGGTSEGPAFAIFEEQIMVATSDSKMICNALSDACELYDLVRDPGEHRNLYRQNRPEEPALFGALVRFIEGDRRIGRGERWTLERLVRMRRALDRQALTPLELGALIGASDALERERGARILASSTEAASALQPALERARHDGVESVRFWATVALARTGDPESRRALPSLARERLEPEGRAWLALAAYEADSAAFPDDLRAGLSTSMDLALARATIIAATRARDVRWREDLVRWLTDADLADLAADALVAIDPGGAVRALSRALEADAPPESHEALSRVLAKMHDPSASASLMALARATRDWAEFGEAALALHEIGQDPGELAGVASSFVRLSDRAVYRTTLTIPPLDYPWVECWMGIEGPSDDLPRVTLYVNGEMAGEDDPSVPALRFTFASELLRRGQNTVDIAYEGDPLPVRGVVIAPPKTAAARVGPRASDP